MHIQNYTKNYKLLTLPDDEPVKRAPTGSGRVPVASGTGAEAPAAASGVRAAPVLLGRRWSYQAMGAEARARAGRRGGRSPGVAWAVVPGGDGGYAYASERERRQNEPTRAWAVG
jgi:hypothetical protein